MRTVTLDFETYYDSEYSLKKMSTESYIRDDRFEVIGVSVKINTDTPIFYRGASDDILRGLNLAAHGTIVVSHNAKFDMGILAFRYGIHPYMLADTMSMAMVSGLSVCAGGSSLATLATYAKDRLGWAIPYKGNEVHAMLGIHASNMTEAQWGAYGAYCILDTEISYQLYCGMYNLVPANEMQLIHVTLEMYTRPVFALDLPKLLVYRQKLEEDRVQALTVLADAWGVVEYYGKTPKSAIDVLQGMFRSGAKFATMLESLGVQPPTKPSPTAKKADGTPKLTWAFAKTDIAFMDLVDNHPDARVRDLCEAKLSVQGSLAVGRTERMIEIAQRGGLFCIPLTYGGAHTLRYSGSRGEALNVQNFPKRNGDVTLRECIIAPVGYVILSADSSQIECRVEAYIAQEAWLLNAFRAGEDPYSYMAAGIYGVPYAQAYAEAKITPTKEGKARRAVGKEAVLSCGYQISGDKFSLRLKQQRIDVPDGEAQRIVKVYRAANLNIVNSWGEAQRVLEVMIGGGSIQFGGPRGDLFFADGSTQVFGERMATIKMPNGTYLRYKNLRYINDPETGKKSIVCDMLKDGRFAISYMYGGKLMENLCQALAFVILKEQALAMYARGVIPKMNVHDEWVVCVPIDHAGYAARVLGQEMRRSPAWCSDLPLDCEVDVGHSYGASKTLTGV